MKKYILYTIAILAFVLTNSLSYLKGMSDGFVIGYAKDGIVDLAAVSTFSEANLRGPMMPFAEGRMYKRIFHIENFENNSLKRSINLFLMNFHKNEKDRYYSMLARYHQEHPESFNLTGENLSEERETIKEIFLEHLRVPQQDVEDNATSS